MGLWHCPHCGTPQAEAARCWVCRRSSTTCRTCRNFRTAVAGGLGFCALDRHRAPLRGDEVRGCWEAVAARPAPPDRPTTTVTHEAAPAVETGWAEVVPATIEASPGTPPPPLSPRPPSPPPPSPHPGTIDPPPVGLWGEIEP